MLLGVCLRVGAGGEKGGKEKKEEGGGGGGGGGTPKLSEKTLFHLYISQHKPHMNLSGIERSPPRKGVGDLPPEPWHDFRMVEVLLLMRLRFDKPSFDESYMFSVE